MRVEWGYRMDTRDGWWAAGCPSALLKAPVRWSLFCLPSIVMQRGWTIPYESTFLCEEISSELCLDWRVSQESTDEVCWNPLCSELGHYLRLSHLSLSLPGLSNLAWAFGCLEVEGLGKYRSLNGFLSFPGQSCWFEVWSLILGCMPLVSLDARLIPFTCQVLLVESPLISRQCDKLDVGHHQVLSSVFFHGFNNIPDLNGWFWGLPNTLVWFRGHLGAVRPHLHHARARSSWEDAWLHRVGWLNHRLGSYPTIDLLWFVCIWSLRLQFHVCCWLVVSNMF